eukprot:TRINITY_DN3329_c0_g1_i5.p1 TRINITY_DN3329_c0_g1~~TRINITY_DN3329_c0_g1_i5.p1  ORF type:complete len:909 (-),score=235.71 TRINITY_DN3329_c0_g1_i5:1193-3526(-)
MRCGDLDKELPELMGVSRAILQYVIFCHQEESNWPLQDSKSLKERFDKIFSATRYTKALDNLKQQKKTLQSSVKELTLQKETIETKRDQARRIRLEIQNAEEMIENSTQEMERLDERILNLTSEIKAIKKRMEEISSIIVEKQKLEVMIRKERENLQFISNDIKEEYTCDDIEMMEMKENFQHVISSIIQQIKAHETLVNQKRTEKKNLQQKLKDSSLKAQKLEIQKKQAEETLKRILSEISNLISSFQISDKYPFSNPETNDDIMIFIQISKEIEEQFNSKYQSEKQNIKSQYEIYMREIETNRQELINMEQQITNMKNQDSNATREISSLDDKIRTQSKLFEEINNMKSELKSMSNNLNSLTSVNTKDIEDRISQIDFEVADTEKRINQCTSDMTELNLHSAKRGKLDHLRKERDKYQSEYLSLDREIERELINLFGEEELPDPESRKLKIEKILVEKRSALESLNTSLNEMKQKLSQLLGQKERSERQINTLLSERQNHQDILGDLAGVDLNQKIRQKEIRIQENMHSLSLLEGAEKLYSNFVALAESEGHCPLCSSKIHDIPEFVRNQEEYMTRIPSSKNELMRTISAKEERKSTLLRIKPSWEEVKRLDDSIPPIQSEIEEMESLISDLSLKIEEETESIKSRKNQLGLLSELLHKVATVSSSFKMFREYSESVNAIEAELSSLSNDSRTIEDINIEISNLQNSKVSLQNEQKKLSQELKTHLHDLSAAKIQYQQLENDILSRQNLNQSIIELQEKKRNLSKANRGKRSPPL